MLYVTKTETMRVWDIFHFEHFDAACSLTTIAGLGADNPTDGANAMGVDTSRREMNQRLPHREEDLRDPLDTCQRHKTKEQERKWKTNIMNREWERRGREKELQKLKTNCYIDEETFDVLWNNNDK
jgi:hypothetical protein